jgi:hypothetical protein
MKRNYAFFVIMLLSMVTFVSSNQLNAQSSGSGRRIIVDATSTTNSGTSFSTIKMAVDSALSGDTVIVSEGTYKEKVRSNQRLVIASKYLIDGDTSHISKTIISGDGVVQNSNADALIYCGASDRDTSYFKVIGLTITNAPNFAVYLTWGTLRNCILKNSGNRITIPYYLQGSYVINNKFLNNIGVAIIQYDWMNPGYQQKPILANNLFVNNTAKGINGNSSGPNNSGIIYLNSTPIKIINNIFYNNSGDNIFSVSGLYYNNMPDTTLFINNTIYKNKTRTAMFRTWEGQDQGIVSWISYWYNNIIDNNFELATNNYSKGEFMWGGGNSRNSTTILKNNIMASDLNTDASTGFSGNFTFQFNASNLKGSVNLADTANSDFSLISSSPGLGMGLTDVSIPSTDFYGSARPLPVGSIPDVGAIESTYKMPNPKIVTLKNATLNNQPVVQINYSIFNAPAIESILIYKDSVNAPTTPSLYATITYDPTAKSIYTDASGIVAGQKYFYNLKSATYSGTIVSGFSSVVDTVRIPATASIVRKPTGLTLTASRAYVNLNWTLSNSSGNTKVEIYRGSTLANASLIATIKDTAHTYNDTTTYQGSTYYYYLINKDANGVVSESSASATITTSNSIAAIKWYVDNQAGNNGNAGTSAANAFLTTTKAFANAIKGDTVILLPGNYNTKISIAPGVVVGSKYLLDNTDTASIRSTIIDATGLKGTIITYSNSTGGWSNNTRTKYIGLSFTGVSGTAKLFSNSWGSVSSITLDHCLVYNNGNQTVPSDPNGNYEDVTKFVNFGDSTILSNSIFENNFGRIRFDANSFVVTKNIFRNNILNIVKSANNNWVNMGVMDGWINGNNYIIDNIFSNNGTFENTNNGSARQNFILRFGGNDSLFLANNTFYKNLNVPIVFDNQAPVMYVVNNLFHKNDADFYVVPWANQFADLYVENNFFNNDPAKGSSLDKLNTSYSANIFGSDPAFSDSTNLLLAPSSTLINSGKNSYGKNSVKQISTKDVYGTSRPSPAGSKSDIGAVENVFGFPAPKLISADGSNKSVSLKWTKPVNGVIAGYEVYRSTSSIPESASPVATYTINNADSLVITDTALTNLTKYYYRVKAFTASKATYSGFSNELFVKPNVPPTPVDTVSAYGGARSIALKWTDTSSVKRKYNIYRGLVATNLDKIASNVDTTYYLDNSATANTKFFYGIKVVDEVGAASDISKLAFATASNVWIIDTAGKSTGNGSARYPLKSMQYIIDNGQSGDTILINDGVYYENLELIGKSFTILAKNRNKAIIYPLNAGAVSLKIQDQNPWGVTDYPKPKNKFIGLTFTGSANSQWTNEPPAAVAISYNSNPLFESCTFTNNASQILLRFDQSAAEFRNCLIINNPLQNGVFWNDGGQDSSRPRTKVIRFINTTISNNSFFTGNCCSSEKAMVFFNCIISENGYNNQFNDKLFKVYNSIVDNAKFASQSTTNLNLDPQFNNTAAFDYSLSNFSPALGRGVSQLILNGSQETDTLRALTYDFNYNARPNPTGTNADLGAFESKFSVAAPQITRLQKSGSAITLTWDKPDANTNFNSIKVYRDTLAKALDTIAPLSITVDPNAGTKTIADALPANKVYYYALKATVGTGNAAIATGLSNVKSTLDTIFVPSLAFANDTASIKVRATSRNGNSMGQMINLVKLSSDAAAALPKIILYSQEYKAVDSTLSRAGIPSDSLLVLNILTGSGSNSIKFGLNKSVSVSKGKGDQLQIVGAMNTNGDDEFDLVGLFKNHNDVSMRTSMVYLNNKNLSFGLDTVNAPKAFFNQNINSWNQTTNLVYKWDQKTFDFNANNVGQNIESAVEKMDANFDGNEEVVATLHQVKWEPNPSMTLGNNSSISQINSNIKIVKFVDINNDGIPDIFGINTCPGCIGLAQTNSNPLIAFVSNKKDGKFYMYVTGINVDWGSNIFFADFLNNRTVQVLARVSGGNYRVFDFDKTYTAATTTIQLNATLNDGKFDVSDINNDGYPDVVTVDNSGSFIAYINNHQASFVKKVIGASTFNSNTTWSMFNLKVVDLNRDGFKDLMWLENVQEADGSVNWNSNNFVLRSWIQTKGDQVRTAPSALTADAITVSNDGYKVKVKWTPTKDAIDNYMFANLKVDTLASFKAARINNAYNYRASDPTVPIILDKVFARNYPDSIEFNDINLTSKKPYYVALQMVNKDGQSSAFTSTVYSPIDPLVGIDNVIPGLYNARFAWGDYNNDGLLDLAVMGQSDNGNVTKIYQNSGSGFVDLNLTNRAFRYGDIKWVDLNNDGWLDVAMIGQPGSTGVSFQTLINNKGVFEVNTPTTVNGLKYSNMAFGDYDNNGTLDMFTSGQDASGNARSFLYKNDGKGNFALDPEFNSLNVVPNLFNADAKFVDYDLDGDLDLVYAGTDQNNNPNGGVRVNTLLDPKITTNNYNGGNMNNGYTYYLNSYNNDCQCNIGLSMRNARFDMGDIDGDGDIDIVEIGTARKYAGSSYTDIPQLVVIRNQTIENKNAKFGNYFSYGNIYNTTAMILDSISDGDVKLVDFNNDGLLDITVTGMDQSANAVTKFYLNQGGFGNFTLSKNASIPQYSNSAISWGDANGDGNMDLVISGNKAVGSSTSIYLNNQGSNSNKAPTAPANLRFIDQGQGRVLLQWDASTDDHTNASNLYYNLKLGTKPGLSDLRVVQVNAATDQLLTPNTSLIGSNQYYIELPPGIFYWSVQAVDGNYTASHFATSQKLVLKYPWQFVNQGGIVDTRIQPLEKPSFAWADVNNSGVFDFLYLGHVTTGTDYGNPNTPVGLYRNMGGRFSKLKNDSTQFSIAGSGTNFKDELAGIVNAQIKWVDLNNDGLLDLVIAGNDFNNSNGRLQIYKNRGNYKFENITGYIYPGSFGNYLADPKIEFVDLDNNGFKDMIYTGTDNQAGAIGVFKFIGIYKDTAVKTTGIKTAQIKSNLDALLSNVSNVSLAIGDINKDLKTDLAVLYDDGYNAARIGAIYMNTSDTTNAISFARSNTITLPALNNATIDLIDYNNDGLLDLALSGKSQSTGQIFRIYQNKWVDSVAKTVQFVQSNANVKSFENGQTTWGDINSDGYPDIIFSGTRTGVGPISSMAIADPSTAKVNGIIKYNELPTFPFGNYSVMRPSLGDFSGKKVLDLVLVGTEKVTNPSDNTTSTLSSFKILKNVRDLSAAVVDPTAVAGIGSSTGSIKAMSMGSMTTATAEIIPNMIRGFADSTIAVVDSNYIENVYGFNAAPSSPKIASSQIVSQVGSQYLVKLSWKAASDDNTPADGLTYAVSIGTKSGLSDVLDGNAALSTGTRKTPESGNAGKNTSLNVLLSPGTYYWTVQSIDGSNAGSTFAPTSTIQVNGNRSLVERSAPYDIFLNGATKADLYLKQTDSAAKFKLTTADNDSTAVIKYSIISDASITSDAIFKLDSIANNLIINGKPTAASYKVKLRATDNYGAFFEKQFNFTVIQSPTKLLVNDKDSTVFYYTKASADSAKFILTLKATYDVTPSTTPVLTYQYVNGTGGENNGLFDLANTVLINKRKLDDADTIRLRVAVVDQYGLTLERLIKLVNADCTKKPSLVVKANATACLPSVVNLSDTTLTAGSGAALKYSYYTDINATIKVPTPTSVATTGVYYIKAVDSLGCSIAKPIAISVSSKPATPTISAASICQNATTVSLAYTAPSKSVKLVWYGTNATGGTPSTVLPSFNTSAAGIISYYVAQADTAAGCYSDRIKLDITVKANPTIPTISRDTAGYLSSSASIGNVWYKDASAVDSTNNRIKPTTPGSFTVKVTENGCTSTSAAYYYLVTDIINLSADEYIKLAPNPFVSYLNFDFVVKGYQKLNLEVFDIASGVKVANREGVYAGTRLSFNELSSGIYIFKVSSSDNKLNYQFKMVKL